MTLAVIILQVLLVIPIEIGGAVVRAAAGIEHSQPVAQHPAVLGIVNILAFGAVIGWGIYGNRDRPWQEVIPLRPVSVGAGLAIVFTIAGGVIVVSEVDNMFRWVVPMPEFVAEMFRSLFFDSPNRWLMVLVMVVVAPATEEPLFRGIILRGLRGRYRPVLAIVLSSILFGFAHLNPWQFVSAGMLGLLFGWWYLRTRSLVPSLLGHALSNGGVAAAPYLPFQIRGFNDLSHYPELQFQPWWFTALGLVLTVVGILLFRRWTPRAAEPQAEPPPLPR